MRDDFTEAVKRALAARVGNRCSNPRCNAATSGPQTDPSKAVNVGVAAHITAASEGGPRYDSTLSPEQRSSAENGIWLCQNCAALIDRDVQLYTGDVLRAWKALAEAEAAASVGVTSASRRSTEPRFLLMPELERVETPNTPPMSTIKVFLRNAGKSKPADAFLQVWIPRTLIRHNFQPGEHGDDGEHRLFRRDPGYFASSGILATLYGGDVTKNPVFEVHYFVSDSDLSQLDVPFRLSLRSGDSEEFNVFLSMSELHSLGVEKRIRFEMNENVEWMPVHG